MKSNYKLVLDIREDGGINKVEIPFRGTMYQANKAFDGLRIALNESRYKTLDLVLCTGSETGYRINAVKFNGGRKDVL